jgi:hypothetical protein
MRWNLMRILFINWNNGIDRLWNEPNLIGISGKSTKLPVADRSISKIVSEV